MPHCCGILVVGDTVYVRPGITFPIPCTQFCYECKTTLINKDHWKKKIRERGKEMKERKHSLVPSSIQVQQGKFRSVSRPGNNPLWFKALSSGPNTLFLFLEG